MSHGGSTRYSGQLQKMFPGFSKKWQEYLTHSIVGGSGVTKPSMEDVMRLQQRRMPYHFGDVFQKMCRKLKLDPHGDMVALAAMLRERGVGRFFGSQGKALHRYVSLDRGYYGALELGSGEAVLAWSHDLVIAENIPVKAPSPGCADSDESAIGYIRGLMYKQDADECKDKVQGIQALLKAYPGIARDLLHARDPRVVEVLQAIDLNTVRSYGTLGDAKDALVNLHVQDPKVLAEEIAKNLEEYRAGVRILETLQKVLAEPHESVEGFDAVEAFKEAAPMIAASQGKVLALEEHEERSRAASLASIYLEVV